VVDRAVLAARGATAIMPRDGHLAIRGARDVQGKRPWTR
jgi:hypothetical protein